MRPAIYGPNIEWSMTVYAPDGTLKPPGVSMNSAVAALTRFDVAPSGECLEAEWMAVPSEVPIRRRDVIVLNAREEGDTEWHAVYRGVVVIAGAPRATDLRTYKAVGLRQRMYEERLSMPRLDGADVGAMVRTALASIDLPVGIERAVVPDQAFSLGDRYPQWETVGTFLDDIAAAVGSFIVPPGQTYTSQGQTWNAGDIVPAVAWGVDADGDLFFRRTLRFPMPLDANVTPLDVDWEDVVAEEVADRVALAFATEYAQGAHVSGFEPDDPTGPAQGLEAIAHPLVHVYDSGGDLDATRFVPLTTPIDYMREVDLGYTLSGMVPFHNNDAATDGDPTTYASGDERGASMRWQDFLSRTPGSDDKIGFIARIILQRGEGGTPDGPNTNMTIVGHWTDSENDVRSQAFVRHYFDTSPNPDREIVVLPFPTPASTWDTDTLMDARLSIGGGMGARIYDVRVYAIDKEIADRLAQSYLIAPEADPATVRSLGRILQVATHLVLSNVADEGDIEVPVERIEYSITNEEGVVSTFHAGQPHDPELMSQAVVLERLAQRATERS